MYVSVLHGPYRTLKAAHVQPGTDALVLLYSGEMRFRSLCRCVLLYPPEMANDYVLPIERTSCASTRVAQCVFRCVFRNLSSALSFCIFVELAEVIKNCSTMPRLRVTFLIHVRGFRTFIHSGDVLLNAPVELHPTHLHLCSCIDCFWA